jgi:hypothetical protein
VDAAMTLITELLVEISSFQAPALTRTRPTRHQFTWADLVARLKTHRRAASKSDVAGWSPAIYSEGQTRANAAVERVSCAVGDFDHLNPDDYARLTDHWQAMGLSYVLHSSYSSTPEAVSFRAVIPFLEPVSRHDWSEVWARVNHHVFLGLNDPQTKDLSRFFYVPSAPPDALTFAASHDGAPLDAASLPPSPVGLSVQDHEPLDHRAIMEGLPEGQRDWTLYRLACDLRGKNVPLEYALLTVAEAARRCDPPFDVSEAQRKVIEAYRKFGPNPTLELSDGTAQAVEDDVPSFPLDALPQAFADYVAYVARLKVCPPEYVAVPLLVAAGSMIGNVVQIALNRSWVERAQLFAAIVGPPGAKKSPAISSALAPVRAIQQRLGDSYAKQLRQYKEAKASWDKLSKAEREGRDPPVAPEYAHVMTNDVTVEKLAEILSKSKGMLLSHDELATWVLSMDQYRSGKGADRQHFLSMWTGTSFKVDRKINPEPIYVKHPCLGIVGGIQPEMLSSLVDKHGRADGFMDRILWAFPDAIPGRWVDDDDRAIPDLNGIFSALYDCYGITDLDGNHVPLTLRFSAEAKEIWASWYDETEDDITEKRITPSLEGPWAKMPSQCARIALILHMLDGDNSSTVSAGILRRAIAIVQFFQGHARRVYAALAAEGGKDDGLRVMEHLKASGSATQTEISRKVFSGHWDAKRLNALLTDLEARGLITRRTEDGGGSKGRPITYWALAS